jgi:hypothetical protein
MRYPSDMDDQEPTPLQEMREEWRHEVAALQEQVDVAAKLTAKFLAWEARYQGKVLCHVADEELHQLLREAQEYIDQNPCQ